MVDGAQLPTRGTPDRRTDGGVGDAVVGGRHSKTGHVWRSWFWNLYLFVAVALLAGIVTGVAWTASSVVERALFCLMAVMLWGAAGRALLMRVVARPHGIVMHGFTHNTTIPWDDVEQIGVDAMTGGAPSLGGAVSPVVLRRDKAGGIQSFELNVLSGYGLWRQGQTLGERAVAGLNQHLAERYSADA